jgi:hypothetical protein
MSSLLAALKRGPSPQLAIDGESEKARSLPFEVWRLGRLDPAATRGPRFYEVLLFWSGMGHYTVSLRLGESAHEPRAKMVAS